MDKLSYNRSSARRLRKKLPLKQLDVAGTLREMKNLMSEASRLIQPEGSSASSSPIESILETLVDLLLLLRNILKEGTKGRRKNQGLKFSQRLSDPLGNPLQISIKFAQEIFWDPESEEILLRLIQVLLDFKSSPKVSLKTFFMKAFQDLFRDFPGLKETSNQAQGPNRPGQKPGFQRKNRHWNRRQHKRNQNTKKYQS